MGRYRREPAAADDSWLSRARDHAREAYPRECCGIVGRSAAGIAVHPCRNLQDELHERDPGSHPRDARTAYHLDPGDFLRVARELAAAGGEMVAIYHSHVDAGARFSDLDRRQAAGEGGPLLPGLVFLVIAVRDGEPGEARLYDWDRPSADWVEVSLDRLG